MHCFISFSLHNFAVCFLTGLTITSVDKINSDADVGASAASSVSLTSEVSFLSPTVDGSRPKRKSPPTINNFPIMCLNCFENSDDYLKADFESKTVICKKCNHVAAAEDYDSADFTRACLFDKKESSGSGFKKHTETAYLSCLADVKRADNERSLISMRQKEMELKLLELERADKLEDKRQTQQDQLMKFHTDTSVAMHQMMKDLMPKKSPLDKYKEQKAAIAAMTDAGDITPDVAKQLLDKLNADLLHSNLI